MTLANENVEDSAEEQFSSLIHERQAPELLPKNQHAGQSIWPTPGNGRAIRLLSEVHKMLTSWFWLIHLPTESVVDKTWIWKGIYGTPSLFPQSWNRVCQTALPGFDRRRSRDCFHRNLQHFIFSHNARDQRTVWCLDRWENLFLNDYEPTQGLIIEQRRARSFENELRRSLDERWWRCQTRANGRGWVRLLSSLIGASITEAFERRLNIRTRLDGTKIKTSCSSDKVISGQMP